MKTRMHVAVIGTAVALVTAVSGGQASAQTPAANPVQLHIGHVMTSWNDTPNKTGFLPAAVADAKVAAMHAGLAAKTPDNLDSAKLHAGHVLNALDPTVVAKGPGSGYGVKKAAAGALQHIGVAAKTEGASANVKTHTTHVSTSLDDVVKWTDEAIATAQKIQVATSPADASKLVTELAAQTAAISDGMDANKDGSIGWQAGEGGLAQAQMHMTLMMKGEGMP